MLARLFILTLLLPITLIPAGCTKRPATTAEQTWPRPAAPPYLLHLPGISGDRGLDSRLVKSFVQGGFDGVTEVYDWTSTDAGLMALTNQERHRHEAQFLADKITAIRRADPTREIVLTAHSGGTGVIVWALERLPADVQVDRVLLMASALSPQYDLSAALSHVSGVMFNFYSPLDIAVLEVGTMLFGTIDGPRVAAAGCVGFESPPGADLGQYQKLRQYAYTASWLRWGNTGSHIGVMARPFARLVLAPMLMGLTLELPTAAVEPAATQPEE